MNVGLLLKKSLVCGVSNLLKILWIFPLRKKTVFFLSFNGKQFSDNPKAVYDEMLKNGQGYKLIWGFNTPNNIEEATNLDYVKVPSLRFLYVFCTSKYILVNDFINTYLPVRKSQVLINTWHGGGWFKKVGLTDNGTSEYDRFFFDFQCKKHSYFVASSEYFVDTVLLQSFNYKGEILRTGMPRNAIFFQDNEKLRHNIRSHFDCDNNSLLVLYAPTYRNYEIAPELEIDLNRLEKSLSKKFGKAIKILFRAHHLIDSFPVDYNTVIDVTLYPDMQQLLLACDVLVSDYSSCMWDAAIQKKLVIVYAPDAQRYIDNRGFFLNIQEWPFLIAFNNDEMEECISSFEKEQYCAKLSALMEKSQSYESKEAVRSVINVLSKND